MTLARTFACMSLCVFVVACSGEYGDDRWYGSGPETGAYADAGVAGPMPGTPPPVDEPSGDTYEDVGTNPFVRTDHDPFSTFAADVDTASYDIFVRDLEDNLLPHPLSVRLEEYVNFFDYDYPAPEPDAEVPFDIYLAASAHPMGRQLAQLRVGIQAAAPVAFEKLPTNLVFLVDTSGSMSAEDKLPLAQYLLTQTLDVLDGTDTVSIVTYAGDVAVRLGPTPATNREVIVREIAALTAAGGTAGGSGINLAYAQAERGFIEGGFNHVVLCTDGDFNIGISDADELVALIEEKRETGVTLTAIGFGRGNLNDAMMERVSNAGNGIYSVLSSEPQAERYAREKLLHTINHVAKDMKIQVEFNPEHVVAYRLLGYENRAIADMDFRNDVVDAGEVGAGHRVTALYELVLTGQSIPSVPGVPDPIMGEPVEGEREIVPGEMVQVRVRWKDLAATAEDPAHEVAQSLVPADAQTTFEEADRDLLWAAAIGAFAEILKGSPFADDAELDVIEEIVTAQADRDEDRGQFVELFLRARELLAAP